MTYKHGVYDVTSFLCSHPGGEQILNAAGLSIEPFWNVYGMHKTVEIYKLLESYRIGEAYEYSRLKCVNTTHLCIISDLKVLLYQQEKRATLKSKHELQIKIPCVMVLRYLELQLWYEASGP